MPEDSAHSIGQAAKTIRYYEEVGLIPRARRRTGAAHAAGDRLYGEADMGRLRFIRRARIVDLSLTGIRQLLRIAESGCPSQHPTYAQLLRRHMRGIDERINHLVALRSSGESADPERRGGRKLMYVGKLWLHAAQTSACVGGGQCVSSVDGGLQRRGPWR